VFKHSRLHGKFFEGGAISSPSLENVPSINGNPQMSGAVLEGVKAVTAVTIAEVLAKPVDKNVYFMITGLNYRNSK